MESFAKMRSSRQGVLRPLYLERRLTLPLAGMWEQYWVTEVRPANTCVTRQETGVDSTQHGPAKHHLEPCAAVPSLIITDNMALPNLVRYNILVFGVMDKFSWVILHAISTNLEVITKQSEITLNL